MLNRVLSSLLARIVVAIVLGALCGLFFPEPIARIFVTFNGLFSAFLGFLIPVLILALVAPAIADLGRGAGKWLAITAAVAYGSTITAGLLAFGTSLALFPSLLADETHGGGLSDPSEESLSSFFTIEMPPPFGIMTALLLAFSIGVGVTLVRGTTLKNGLEELRDIIMLVVTRIVIPLLPVYVFGSFMSLTMNGQIGTVITTFFKVVITALVLTVILLLLQYAIAGAIAGKNPFRLLKNMLPAYFTALGTSSSAATIPVTLQATRNNGVDEDVAGFAVPLCATIHLAGSTVKIVLFSTAVMMLTGIEIDPVQYIGFILMLGITMVAAPGVPGGAIMAAVGILQSMLGFDEAAVSIMIATYVAIDSLGTATNVTGDGAIAVAIDRFYKKSENVHDNVPAEDPQPSAV
ncbi:dicarboxylate/amino acid:cation symporter [Kocuria sp. p3-SID1433]|uniref:dicarboxylate/amino acid:cation symporter n=1 Tax=unclassified Kocuria TaxID=2649579 RepID=UPI0021A3DFA2|nr:MULTISPECIES: dicarboxylate/amino acid:cation symporter [unclassified Kocuria]MCT1602835.1 dicarboxylate/amino acid:cation symporter [Kocuria sp. p3-SID1428]MCT2181297.1 dicarboxylate/amino acid:cation symporter [Kocuria sp. p3-SID1433]